MKKANIIPIFVISLALLFSLSFGVNYVNLTANGGKSIVYASPGEEITIELEENIEGSLTRNVFFLDYESINWKNGHKWKATPGIHMIRRFIRWDANTPLSQIPDGASDYDCSHKCLIVIVDEGSVNINEFRHPGLQVTASQLGQIQKNIQISDHPMKSAWNSFKSSADNDLGRLPNAMDTLNMKGDADAKNLWDKDGVALSRLSLAWAISGDKKYAKVAIKILNDWAAKNKALRQTYTDQYAFLHQTNFYGSWINAVELLRYYKGNDGTGSGWTIGEIAQWDKYFKEVFAPMTMGWGGHGNGVWNCQNQNLNVYKARMMAAIHSNNRGMFDAASYLMFENKRSYSENMEVHGKAAITYVEQSIGSVNHLGELMEISRGSEVHADFGHVGMCLSTINQMSNFLWHQRGYVDNYDFYGLVIDNDPKPRQVHMIDWIAAMAIIGGPYTKQQFENDNDPDNDRGTILPASSSTGAVRSKYKSTQKVIARTDLYTGAAHQYYNHYHYEMNNAVPIASEYADIAKNGGGTTTDRLLFARLNDGWVSPDTANDQVDAINKNFTSTVPNISFVMGVSSSKMLMVNSNGNIKNASIKIYNLNGRLLKNVAVNNRTTTISLKKLNHGLYLVKFTVDGAGETRKLVVK